MSQWHYRHRTSTRIWLPLGYLIMQANMDRCQIGALGGSQLSGHMNCVVHEYIHHAIISSEQQGLAQDQCSHWSWKFSGVIVTKSLLDIPSMKPLGARPKRFLWIEMDFSANEKLESVYETNNLDKDKTIFIIFEIHLLVILTKDSSTVKSSWCYFWHQRQYFVDRFKTKYHSF